MVEWINPVQGSSIHQGFRPPSNPGHQGLDLGFDNRSPMGAPILAPRDGIVVYISPMEPAGGNVTNINHDDGYQTRYDHQSEFLVSLGDQVVQGQVIGLVGATGAVTGPHLHYEIHHPVGNPIDPTPYLGIWVPPTPVPPPQPKREDPMIEVFVDDRSLFVVDLVGRVAIGLTHDTTGPALTRLHMTSAEWGRYVTAGKIQAV